MLDENDICFYETPVSPGNYRECSSSIWTRCPEDAERALRLIEEHSLAVQQQAREQSRQDHHVTNTGGNDLRWSARLVLIGVMVFLVFQILLYIQSP